MTHLHDLREPLYRCMTPLPPDASTSYTCYRAMTAHLHHILPPCIFLRSRGWSGLFALGLRLFGLLVGLVVALKYLPVMLANQDVIVWPYTRTETRQRRTPKNVESYGQSAAFTLVGSRYSVSTYHERNRR